MASTSDSTVGIGVELQVSDVNETSESEFLSNFNPFKSDGSIPIIAISTTIGFKGVFLDLCTQSGSQISKTTKWAFRFAPRGAGTAVDVAISMQSEGAFQVGLLLGGLHI